MAVKHVFYRSVEIGDGSGESPFRSSLDPYIHEIPGTEPRVGFWDMVHNGRSVRYAFATAEEADLNAASADSNNTEVSPRFDDMVAVNAWLDGSVTTLPPAAETVLENDGFSVAWVTAGNTVRELLKYMGKIHVMSVDIGRFKDELAFIQENLDSQVNVIPQAKRQAAQTWMENKGLDTSWIGPTTLVRQVIQYIIENIAWPYSTFRKGLP